MQFFVGRTSPFAPNDVMARCQCQSDDLRLTGEESCGDARPTRSDKSTTEYRPHPSFHHSSIPLLGRAFAHTIMGYGR